MTNKAIVTAESGGFVVPRTTLRILHHCYCTFMYIIYVPKVYRIFFLHTEGNSTHQRIFELVADQLTSKYHKHILPSKHREWVFINCGGWMGAFYLLHVSMTEYVLFFGTAIHTSGNSGEFCRDSKKKLQMASHTL